MLMPKKKSTTSSFKNSSPITSHHLLANLLLLLRRLLNKYLKIDIRLFLYNTLLSIMSYITTTNGAVSLKTTGSYIVDYFMLFVRDLDKKVSYEYLEKCWKEDPTKTVAIIFNGRDRVNGKKEKKVANQAMMWLRKYKFVTYCD